MPSGRLAYLTAEDIASKRGREVAKECGSEADLVGHGAIRLFFDLKMGTGRDREYTYFVRPEDFPDELSSAIKAGKFRGMGCPPELLSKEAAQKYAEFESEAYKMYRDEADAELVKCRQIRTDLLSVKTLSEYERLSKALTYEYYAKIDHLDNDFRRVLNKFFWDLFADVENRADAWK
jgi:hypothetical protein